MREIPGLSEGLVSSRCGDRVMAQSHVAQRGLTLLSLDPPWDTHCAQGPQDVSRGNSETMGDSPAGPGLLEWCPDTGRALLPP